MNLQQENNNRDQLLTMFSIALSTVDGQHCTHAFMSTHSIPNINIRAVAIGKAAAGMMQGALTILGNRLRSGLVITKQSYAMDFMDKRISCLESDHPIPTQRSLIAGERLLEFVKQVKADELLLVLISGGTSALVEVLNKTVTTEQLMKLNNWCISNPYSIAQINSLRKSISKIKAGQLLNYIHTEHVLQLTISDVQGNDLSVIGSGLLVADNGNTPDDSILSDIKSLPKWIETMIMADQAVPEFSIKSTIKVQHHIIADNRLAREAIVTYSRQQGLAVHLNQEIYLEFSLAVEEITQTLINGESGLYIWGGECVLKLPEHPGQGGRCQSLALALAEQIKDMNILVLAAGTDGSDGPGEVAGAMVDGYTIKQGEELGLNAVDELEKANAGYYLSEIGNLIDTGPTNTNVSDLIIALKY